MKYFIIKDGLKSGPFSYDELSQFNLSSSTMVWRDGLEEWTKANTVSELQDLITTEPPPIPSEIIVDVEPSSQKVKNGDQQQSNEGVKKNILAVELKNLFFVAVVALVIAACSYPFFMSESDGATASTMLAKWEAAHERSSFSGWLANKDKPGASEKYVQMIKDLKEESYQNGYPRTSYDEPSIHQFKGHFERRYNTASEAASESAIQVGIFVFIVIAALRYLFLGGKWVAKNS